MPSSDLMNAMQAFVALSTLFILVLYEFVVVYLLAANFPTTGIHKRDFGASDNNRLCAFGFVWYGGNTDSSADSIQKIG